MKLTWNEQNEPAEPLIYVGAENSAQALLVMTNPVEDSISTSCTTGEIDPENTVRSMRKQARDHIVDKLNLNSCLCGSVVDPSMEGVIKCKHTSCETQWVSKFDMVDGLQQLTLSSIILNAWEKHSSLETGFVRLARRLVHREQESVHVDDVILLYLEVCLVT